ncbi:MAG TPA: hypothetical protein VGO47_02925, partial [Chlamydiales bacterium]|nr:hypothetical protein [Chlamydiales bacterium]
MGLEIGIIPKDPREAVGACNAIGVSLNDPFEGTYSSWQTGGAGAGAIDPTISSEFPWPPTTVAGIPDPHQVTL